MSIATNLRKRIPVMLLSLIMVFTLVFPGLSVTANAAGSEALAAWNVSTVSGTTVNATSGAFQTSAALQLMRDGVPYTISYTSGGVQAGTGGTSAASNLAGMADKVWWVVNLSSVGYKDITVEWRMRSTNTGPRDFKVQYSTDGTEWLDAINPDFQNTNNGSNQPIDSTYSDFTGVKGKTLPVGADDQSTLYVRWLLTSNTSVNSGSVADGGTNTINNIVISGASLSGGADDITEINILTFNDFHGQVEMAGSNPGAARFAACAKQLLTEAPNAFMVAGGDTYQGSAVSNYYLGKPVSDMMKAIGIEYSSLGNHEFDWGWDKIPQFAADGNIEFICSNLFYKDTNNRPDFVKPFVVKEIGGKQIGIVGFIITDTPTLVKAEYAEPFDFRTPGAWLTELVTFLKNDQGCDAVIALSHDNNTSLLAGYGLAGVVNGHSHAYQATVSGGTAFVQAGYNGRAIGRLQLVFNNQTGACTVTPSYQMISSFPAGLTDANVQAVIDRYLADSASMFDAVVGQADIDLPNQSVVNSWATRLVYDFIERQTGTPYVVIQNSGGWRNMSGLFLDEGDDINYRWLTVLMPFDNEIVLMDLPGNYLLAALNGTRADGSGSPTTAPVIAGAYRQDGSWYLQNGTLITPGGTYKVSCNDFMLTGGDNYDMFQYGTNVRFLGDKLRDTMVDQITFRSASVASVLSLTTDANLVKAGDYFKLYPSFDTIVNSNAAILTLNFDAGKFQYRGFTPAAGVTLVNTAVDGGQLKLTLMTPDYSTKDFGEILFSVKDDAALANADNVIGMTAELAVKEDDETKSIRRVQASVTFTTSAGAQGPYTLIDLSNLIDWFGVKAGDAAWAQARFFDFNGNGEIDIQDIATLAQMID